jgi:tRNA nucleotidyltransferase (CCA-adding enzyme)
MKGQSDYRLAERQEVLSNIIRFHDEIMEEGNVLSIKDLAVNGKDIMDLGIPKGPKVGETLSYLLERVLEEPTLNEKSKLEDIIKGL